MSEEKIKGTIGFIDYELLKDKGVLFNDITPAQAAGIRDNYNRFFLTPPIVTRGGDRISGFTFTRKDVEMALYGAEQSNPTVNGSLATEFHVSFAYHDGIIVPNLEGFTTVIYGVDANGLIAENNRVRDYSKPCPDNCPEEDQDTER